MINPNYNYVDPIANQFTSNIAKGVPHQVANRNIIRDIDDNQNLGQYNRKTLNSLKKSFIAQS